MSEDLSLEFGHVFEDSMFSIEPFLFLEVLVVVGEHRCFFQFLLVELLELLLVFILFLQPLEKLFPLVFHSSFSIQFAIWFFCEVLQFNQTFPDALVYFSVQHLEIPPFKAASKFMRQFLAKNLISFFVVQIQVAQFFLLLSVPLVEKLIWVVDGDHD